LPQSKAGAPPQAATGTRHCAAEQPAQQNLYINTLKTLLRHCRNTRGHTAQAALRSWGVKRRN